MQLKTYGDSCLFERPNLELPGHTSFLKSPSVSSIAQIVADELLLAAEYHGITLKHWVILPNELHALMTLSDDHHSSVGGRLRDRVTSPRNRAAFSKNHTTSKPRWLTTFIATFKAATAKRINLLRNQPGALVWRRSYNEQLMEDGLMIFRLQHKLLNLEKIVMSSE